MRYFNQFILFEKLPGFRPSFHLAILIVVGIVGLLVIKLSLPDLVQADAPGTVNGRVKIASGFNGGPAISDGDLFGAAVTRIGDLNRDGVQDLVAGAYFDDTGSTNVGAVHVMFMKPNGTVSSTVKIGSGLNGGPILGNSDAFGVGLSGIGDLNKDGVEDLAVGALWDDTGGSDRGAVHILFMKANGTVSSSIKIAHDLNGGPTLADSDQFGLFVSRMGDLNKDGVADLAVGAFEDDTGGFNRGAIYVLFMKPDGTAVRSIKIAHNLNGGPALADNDKFGTSVSEIGDLNQDGVQDLAAGAYFDDTGGTDRGAVYILFMKANGTVKSHVKIAHNLNGGPVLVDSDIFGTSISKIGDIDQDGVEDLAVGAYEDGTGGPARGAVYVLLMKANGTVKSRVKIAHNLNGGPPLADGDHFGSLPSGIGDLNRDGVEDLAVGTPYDDTGGNNRGAVYILFLDGASNFVYLPLLMNKF